MLYYMANLKFNVCFNKASEHYKTFKIIMRSRAGRYTGIVSNLWYLSHTGFDTTCFFFVFF